MNLAPALRGIYEDPANETLLGTAAFSDIGTTAGKVAAADDPRFNIDGSATINFGSGAQRILDCEVQVTGQPLIKNGSRPKAWFMGSSTSDNDADAHAIATQLSTLCCDSIIPGAGFRLRAISGGGMTGQFKAIYNYHA